MPDAAIDRLARADLNLATAWEAVAATVPDHPAVAHGAQVWTWRAFDERAARLAAAFDAHGVRTGDKVGLFLYNGNQYLETEFAAFKVRAVPCNVNHRYLADELAYVLGNADAVALVYDHRLRAAVDAVRSRVPGVRLYVEVGGGEPPSWAEGYEPLLAEHRPMSPIERSGSDQWFLYTGGTTGWPKAVVWEHRALLGGMEATFRPLGVDVPTTVDEVVAIARAVAERGAEVRQLAASPLMHGTAGLTSKATLSHGGLVATMQATSLDAHELWRLVQRHRITQLTIVGDAFTRPMLAALDEADARGEPYDLSSLRNVVSSGVMWSEPMKQALLERHDMLLVDVLGSSEGSGMAKQLASRKRKGATARFSLGEHTRVVTDDMRDVVAGSGEIGRIALGFPIPLGYYKDAVKTEATFPTIDGRRWSIPGDFATVEEDGTITLLGRGSACINTGGEKVFPEEVEEVLKTHPGVLDANVVGVADERWGQAVHAVVSVRAGSDATPASIAEHVRAHLAGYKVPKRIVSVDEVRRGANGKPDYAWARSVLESTPS